MNATKMIKEILVKPMGEKGFSYDKGTLKDWFFRKKEGESEKRITIHNIGPGETRMYFDTKAYGQRTVYVDALITREEAKNRMSDIGHFLYNSEEEYRNILREFLEIIEERGMDCLEKMSVPTTEIRPSKEDNVYLYENHERLAKEYEEKYNLYEEDIWKELEKIEECIKKLREQPFQEVKEELIGIGAVYGMLAVKKFKGKWKINSQTKLCIIEEFEDTPLGIVTPLERVVSCYRSEHYEYISKDLEYIQDLTTKKIPKRFIKYKGK